MKVGVAQYYKAFGILYGALASLPFVPPLLRLVKGESTTSSGYLFPPLGDVDHLLLTLTVLLLALVSYLVFAFCRLTMNVSPRYFALFVFSAVLGVLALIALYASFVRQIAVPSAAVDVSVSIGYQRTDFANKNYPGWDEWDMLHDRGPSEEAIQRLWTLRSIVIVRLLLWLSYFTVLSSSLSAVCLAAYQHALELASVGKRIEKEANPA